MADVWQVFYSKITTQNVYYTGHHKDIFWQKYTIE